MNGTVTFTKEFQEKTKSNLSNRQKGELRVKKLKEAEAVGLLGKAKTRKAVAELVGFNKKDLAGATWVARMVNKKILSETITHFKKNGRAEYEYHIINNSILKPSKKTPTPKIPEQSYPVKKINTPQATNVNIPLQPEQLAQGFSLTLNINFNIGK